MSATSLAAVLVARERIAASELALLEEHLAAAVRQQDDELAWIDAAEMWSARLNHLKERHLADAERERADLAAVVDTVAAKRAELARLRERGQLLAGAASRGGLGAAQEAVLRQIDGDARAANDAILRLIEQVGLTPGAAAVAEWSWPLDGIVTQRFGPTSLALVPPRTYGGIAFAHFHDGLDIAAPMRAPVTAAAPGRVGFVGHLPDGAMIVLIAHEGGLVSLYAHLDDVLAPPRVRAGEDVRAGQVIGFVGMTGWTTGPHLHFVVRRAGELLDPLTLLPPR